MTSSAFHSRNSSFHNYVPVRSYFLFAQAKMPHSEICMMFHIYCVDRENRPITGVTILWPETNKTFVIPRHFSRYGWIVENDHCEIEGAIKKVRDFLFTMKMKSHEPFQSYLLTGQADSAKTAG